MENVFFEPWVGNDYWGDGYNGKRILVIGNSHYCDQRCDCCNCGVDGYSFDGGDCSSLTTNAVCNYKPKAHRFFASALAGYICNNADDYMDAWNSVAFYNYLQTAVEDGSSDGDDEYYENSEAGFWEVLENLEPDGIIVWGNRTWNKMPAYNGDNCYELDNGKEIPAISVTHPSARNGRFNYNYVHDEIQDFVNNL